jgi:hypothetical protein
MGAEMIVDLLTTLLLVAVLGLATMGLLAPLESLRWWAGWSGAPMAASDTAAGRVLDVGPPQRILVYLSGIGSIAGDALLAEEVAFLNVLASFVPDTVIVRSVFPYSVSGIGLTGARAWAQMWRLLERLRLHGDNLVSSFINLRNLFQVAVATDPRYGPLFSYGVACVIARESRAAGLQPGPRQELVLFGYSAGAQIAVGAAPFLREMLGVTVHVVSLGGVLNSDAGIAALFRLDHLVGERDRVERIGRIVYPGRWSMCSKSVWNTAVSDGVVRIRRLPGMRHNTPDGYMDGDAHGTNGESYPLATARAIADALNSSRTPAA